ncbi:MAG: MipA/OmpV family protein [Gammaproteobacteria bacterium]|nr:MipA/OmpV family protein [Gammaproteobacteria bacterium]
MKAAFCVIIAALALPGLASAQGRPPGAEDGWSLGAAVIAADSPYVGEGSRVLPVPSFGYEGERFSLRGLTGAFHLVDSGAFQLDLLASARLDGFDIDDLSASGLAANGVDAALLEDRGHGLDAGVGLSWSGTFGRLRLEAVADVTDASGGQEVGLDYVYPVRAGAWTVLPGVGVSWMSADLARYYFGTLDREEARGVTPYRPGTAVVPDVGVFATRRIGERWSLQGGLQYRFLPDELADSPLLNDDGVAVVILGMSYRF